MPQNAKTAEHQIEEALNRPGVRNSLRFAVRHLNASLPDKITEEELLGSLLSIEPYAPDRLYIGEFLNEIDLETLSDLVTAGGVSYAELAHAASLHLPFDHETRRWIDDRKAI